MQARFETPTKARSTGHTPKPLIVGDRAAIAAAVNEYISTPEKPILTPDKRTYGGLNGVQTMHHLHPCCEYFLYIFAFFFILTAVPPFLIRLNVSPIQLYFRSCKPHISLSLKVCYIRSLFA